MAVLASDDFNRANNADLGSAWDVLTGESNFTIVSNQVVPTSVNSDCAESYNGVTWPNDQYSQIVWMGGTGASTDTGVGPALRCAVGARTYYRITAMGTSANTTMIAKMVAGAHTTLASQAASWVANDVCYASVIGSAPATIQVKRNGTNLFSTTDSAIASGRAGITYSGSVNTPILDTWEGGDFASTFTPIMQRVYGVTVVRAAYH